MNLFLLQAAQGPDAAAAQAAAETARQAAELARQAAELAQVPAPPPWVTLPPAVIVLVTLAMCAAAAVVLWPLMRAIGRRIEGRAHDPALQDELARLRARVDELEGAQLRVAELEERVDFAERLLAQRREHEPLPPR